MIWRENGRSRKHNKTGTGTTLVRTVHDSIADSVASLQVYTLLASTALLYSTALATLRSTTVGVSVKVSALMHGGLKLFAIRGPVATNRTTYVRRHTASKSLTTCNYSLRRLLPMCLHTRNNTHLPMNGTERNGTAHDAVLRQNRNPLQGGRGISGAAAELTFAGTSV